jgi:hypothetical protein
MDTSGLTVRQLDVLALLAWGKTRGQVARILGSADVGYACDCIITRLGASNMVNAVSIAHDQDLIGKNAPVPRHGTVRGILAHEMGGTPPCNSCRMALPPCEFCRTRHRACPPDHRFLVRKKSQ